MNISSLFQPSRLFVAVGFCLAVGIPVSASAALVRLEAEDYKAGANGVTYSDNGGGNNGGAYRTDDVDIEASSGSAGHNVGWTAGGEWLQLSADTTPNTWGDIDPTFNTTGHYLFNTRFAASPDKRDGRFHLELDGTNQITSNFGSLATGSWQTYKDAKLISLSPITAGTHALRLHMDDNGSNMDYVEFDDTTILTPFSITATGTTRVEAEDYQGYYDNNDVGPQTEGGNSGQSINNFYDTELLEYLLDVDSAGLYDLTFSLSRGVTTATVTDVDVWVDGSNIATLDVPHTGGWTGGSYQDFTVSNLSLQAGTQVLRISNQGDQGINFDYVDIALVPEPTSALLLLLGVGTLGLARRRPQG